MNLAHALEALGRSEEAIAEYRKAIQLEPYNATTHSNLGEALVIHGKPEETLAAWREGIAKAQEMIRTQPRDAGAYNFLAWFLANAADPDLRQPAQAVELATKAVELAPKEGAMWNTLGVARYRNGQWKEAITALEKSVELGKRGGASDWLFLAMAHWQVGNKEEARRWYDKAIEWMEKRKSKNEELLRFRAEAEELLGIPAKPPGKNGKETPEKPKAASGRPKPES